jgi:hypothetical protein
MVAVSTAAVGVEEAATGAAQMVAVAEAVVMET